MHHNEKLIVALIISLIVLSIVTSSVYYSELPEKMPGHWNIQGEPDSYLDKPMALMIFPVVSAFMLLLYLAVPRIDPLKRNIKSFRGYFDGLIALIALFLLYLHFITVAWGLGYRFSIGQMISPLLAALYYYVGVLLENAERNWFIGIRTPWTLSSNEVWSKTHERGSKLFKLSGLIALLGFVFPVYAPYTAAVPVVLASVYVMAYSYFKYREVNAEDELQK